MQSSDDLLVARIAARAAPAPRGRRLGTVRAVRMQAWLAAAAVLLLGAIASAWWVARPNWGARRNPAPTTDVPSAGQPSRVHGRRGQGVAPRALATSDDPPPTTMDEPAALSAAPPSMPVAAEPVAPAAASGLTTGLGVAAATPSTPAVDAKSMAGGGAREPSADVVQRFARANWLRREGRNREAQRMYREIVDESPRSREAPLARLALAKLVEKTNPAQAMSHYRALANSTGPLRAEGLWGVAETARALGQSAVRERALSELLEEFPDSPYAAVARERKDDGAR